VPIFSQSDRITISKRQITIPNENAVFDFNITKLGNEEDKFEEIDEVNELFYNEHNNNINYYFDESEHGAGLQYTKITQQDIDDAVNQDPANIFFPTSPPYTFLNPKVADKVNGLPTTNVAGEAPILTDTTVQTEGLLEYIDWMRNGITSSIGDDTLIIAYSGGTTMEVTLGLPDPNTYIAIQDVGLFYVTAKGPIGGGPNLGTELTVIPIIAGTGVLGDTIQSNIPGYSDGARQSPGSPGLLSGYSSSINGKILAWETKLNNQLTALNLNADNRAPQTTEIANSIADINNALSIISNWLAAPFSGVGGKFTDSQILLIESEANDRLNYLTTRATEITIALGNVTQDMSGNVSGNGIFKSRYDTLNLRINKVSGSLSNKIRLGIAKSGPQGQKDGNLAALSQYDQFFLTTKLTVNANGTNTITVDSVSGFSISNTVFVMADTQSELTGTITNISGLDVTLDFIVPSNYTIINKARLYKLL